MGLQHNRFKPYIISLPLLRMNRIIASIGLVIMHDLGQLTDGEAGKTNSSDFNAPCIDLNECLPYRKH